MEKFLEVVCAGWYIGSILAVLLATFTSSTSGVKLTLVCPLVYHLIMTYTASFHLEGWAVCNPTVGSHRTVMLVHGLLFLLCVFLVTQSENTLEIN